jgi:NADH-quinone oxidoreductase subunit G
LLSPSLWINFLTDLLDFLKESGNSELKVKNSDTKRYANQLLEVEDRSKILIFVGPSVFAHSNASLILSLCKSISEVLGCKISYLPAGGNVTGGYFSKALPENGGFNSLSMFDNIDASFMLINAEPNLDFSITEKVKKLINSKGVIALTSYKSAVSEFADVMLPIATYMETEGSYINMEGLVQHAGQVVEPPGEARPIWKILRVLGSFFSIKDFDFNTLKEVRSKLIPELIVEKKIQIKPFSITNIKKENLPAHLEFDYNSEIFNYFPIYLSDLIVRRAPSLQKTKQAQKPKALINSKDFEVNNLSEGSIVEIVLTTSSQIYQFVCEEDDNVAIGTVAIACGHFESKNVSGLIASIKSKNKLDG